MLEKLRFYVIFNNGGVNSRRNLRYLIRIFVSDLKYFDRGFQCIINWLNSSALIIPDHQADYMHSKFYKIKKKNRNFSTKASLRFPLT